VQAVVTAGAAAAAAVLCDSPVARTVAATAGGLLALQGVALGITASHASASRWLLAQLLLLVVFATAAAAVVFSLAR
jgi:hypothetical protein